MFRKPFLEMTRQGKAKRLKSASTNQGNKSNVAESIEETNNTKKSDGVPTTSSNPFCQVHDLQPIDDQNWLTCIEQEPLSDISDDDCGEDIFDSMNELVSLRESLHGWATSYNINLSALSALLCILRLHKCFAGLPSDGRTLVHTPTDVSMVSVAPGHYSHIGLEGNLRRILGLMKGTVSHIEVLCNIDGLPLFKSSAIEFWPILGMITNVPAIKYLVLPIGIYCGAGKPKSCADFLAQFVTEARNLIANGLEISGKHLSFSIKGFVCDTPAKSYILNVKGHAGYSSCTKCKQTGVYINNRMTFPEFDAAARTNESIRSREDEDFNMGPTALTAIPELDFVRGFPLDYMHLVCLGVVRSIVYLWMFGPVPIKLPSQIINKISSELISLRNSMPVEFNRKPRSLNEVKRWKATEFRQFLLYTGPVILKKIFAKEYNSLYNHFLSLSISISILVSPTLNAVDNFDYAKNLLTHFVKTVKSLYGRQYITHNMHGLTHLADSVKDFGPLDSSSSFPFENFLQVFKKLIRKGDKPLPQVIKRLSEMMHSDTWFSSKLLEFNVPTFLKIHFSGPLLDSSDVTKQYSCVKFSDFTIITKPPDSCCILKCGRVVVVENIVFSKDCQEMTVICREFLEKADFFSSPFMNSSVMQIYLVSDLSDLKEYCIKDIAGKMVLLPFNNKHVAFPLLHSL